MKNLSAFLYFVSLIAVMVSCATKNSLQSEAILPVTRKPFQLRTVTLNQTGPEKVKHIFRQRDSLWFLSQIYYGKGDHFQELMSANEIADPRQIEVGTEIEIPNPKFHPEQSEFQERLAKISRDRDSQLAARVDSRKRRAVASGVASGVPAVKKLPEVSVPATLIEIPDYFTTPASFFLPR